MERFRGLRGFVQRLGGGDGGEVMGTREQTEEILENLPLTKAFIEQLPRSQILQTASSNDVKANEALQLINRIDELVESHATTARDLRDHVSQITTIKNTLSAATTHASRLHAQLIELTSLIAAAEASQNTAELQDFQAAEDAKFESYARRRRAELAERKKGYERELQAFESERASLGDQTSDGGSGVGLESIVVDEAAGGLEDFFGGGGESVQVSKKPKVKKQGLQRGKVKEKPARMVVMADEDIEDEDEVKKWY